MVLAKGSQLWGQECNLWGVNGQIYYYYNKHFEAVLDHKAYM